MQLVETQVIKKSDSRYKLLDDLCFHTKNLYNAALYEIRQYYFETKKYLNYYTVDKKFKQEKKKEYYALPVKVSQQVLRSVDKNFKGFFGSLRPEKVKGKKKSIPKYLDKVKGRFIATFTIQAISKRGLNKGIIKFSGIECELKTKINPLCIDQVRIIPRNGYYKVEVVYTAQEKKQKEDNRRYAAIDLGVNNLATVSSNVVKPYIINGKPLKSINQYANKKVAQLQQEIDTTKNNNRKTNLKEQKYKLFHKRDNKINTYLHKASRFIVNRLVSNEIHTLIIGKNDNWKQETNIGKRNNQNFVEIPYSRFIIMLKYKCELEGINVVITEENYTSKCSFLDNEKICKHVNNEYAGKRIKRGLFRTATGKFINADLNGSLNILRKVIREFQYLIEVCSTPRVETMFDTRKLTFHQIA